MVEIRFARVIEAPSQGEPNTVYFVKAPLATAMDILVAGSDGVPVPLAVRAIGEGGYTDAQVRQVVAAALTAGTNVKIAVDPNAGTFTISATGSTAAADWQGITGKPTTLSGFGITDAQPLDADLTAIAALATAAFGRSMLTAADAPSMRTLLALGTAALATLGTNAGNALQLDGNGKVPANNLPEAILGAMKYQGTWDASANTPALASNPAATTKGFYYVVSVAGGTNLSGVTDWKVGDWAVSNGTTWDKVDSSDQVNSVAGLMGTITASGLRTALSLVIGTDVQAYDSDLQAIAALTTTAFGRGLLTLADATAVRASLAALGLANYVKDFNFSAAGSAIVGAEVAMTLAVNGAAIGSGALSYEKSTAAAPGTFASTTMPATLEAGARLRVTAGGAVYVQIGRTA